MIRKKALLPLTLARRNSTTTTTTTRRFSAGRSYQALRTHTRSLGQKAAHHGNLANKNSHRHYVHMFCDTIQAGLRERQQNEIIDPIAARQLESDLGKLGATNGIMPDFSNIAALRSYALHHFGRARLLSRLITHPTTPEWLPHRITELFPIGSATSTITTVDSDGDDQVVCLASLGGGPGYDFACFAALSEFRQAPPIAATVLDYEPAWSEIVADVEAIVQDVCPSSMQDSATSNNQHQCGYAPCDITLPLDAVINESVTSCLDNSTQVYTCSYAVAENAVKLRQHQYQFFRQLFEEAADGSLFFFTETTHRLWPDLIDLALLTSGHKMRISIPHLRSGKVGWQLAMLKDTVSSSSMAGGSTTTIVLTKAQQELYQRFQKDDKAHRDRLHRIQKKRHRQRQQEKEETGAAKQSTTIQ